MFGFVYTKTDLKYNLIYNGKSKTLRYCCDQEESIKRWRYIDSWKDKKEYEISAYGQTISVMLPIGDGVVITDDFINYIGDKAKSKNFSDATFGIRINYVLKEYDVVLSDIGLVLFKEKVEKETFDRYVDSGLYVMKQVLEGYVRLDNIDKVVGKNSHGDLKLQPLQIGYDYCRKNLEDNNPDFGPIPYMYKGKQYDTNIFGLYQPSVEAALFGQEVDFGGGRVLQRWQQWCLMNLGKINFIAAARGSGKSWVAVLLAGLCTMRQPLNLQERMKPILINYYGETEEDNQQVIDYILKMRDGFKSTEMFKFKKSSYTLEFLDGGKVVGKVRFRSQGEKSKGRGGRPSITVIDEAARIEESVYKTAYSNAVRDGTQIICISTVDPENDKNWFYQKLIEAEVKQLKYEKIEDLVVRLWKKYGMDKRESRDDVVLEDIFEARREMRNSRMMVGMRFTIDDIEFWTKEQKEEEMALAFENMDFNFIQAEFYSRFANSQKIFNIEGLILNQDKIPKKFQSIVVAHDGATEHDNGAAVIIGVFQGKAYVIKSVILSKELNEQIDELKQLIVEAKGMLTMEGAFYFVGDCGQAPQYILDKYTTSGIHCDMPFITTKALTFKKGDGERFYKVGKTALVTNAKMFFDKGYVGISDAPEMMASKGLVDELANFEKIATGRGNFKYEAVRGKDDQVNGMMLGLYCLHERDGLKFLYGDKESERFLRGYEKREEFQERKEQEKKMEKDEQSQFKVLFF